jgi:hypothetical protein
VIPHLKGDADLRQSHDDTFFAPLNAWLAENPSCPFLGGSSMNIQDARFGFFASMVNMLGVFLDGKSFVSPSHAHVYAYLDRYYHSTTFQHATGHVVTPPALAIGKLVGSFKKMGLVMKPSFLSSTALLPLDSPYAFHDFVSTQICLPTFDPPLSPSEQSRFDEIKKIIVENNAKYAPLPLPLPPPPPPAYSSLLCARFAHPRSGTGTSGFFSSLAPSRYPPAPAPSPSPPTSTTTRRCTRSAATPPWWP